MRVGSVMSVIDVIQPVWWPRASTRPRHVQARVEQRAVLALHAHLEAALDGAAIEFVLQAGGEQLAVLVGPIGEGRRAAHQLRLAPAGHLAEGGVDVGDAAAHVQRPHAGEHGVLHGAAEIGLGHQRLLHLHPPAGVAPVGDQHPGGHGGQRAHEPEQAAADDAQAGAVGLRPHDQAVAHGRDRHLVFVRLRRPGQELRRRLRRGHGGAGQDAALAIEQCHGVLGRDLRRHAVAQQAVDRVFAQDHAGELARARQGHVQLQQARAVGAGHRLRIHRRLQVARQAVHDLRLARAQHLALDADLRDVEAGRGVAGRDAAALVDPGEHQHLGVLRDHRFGATHEFLRVHLLVGDVARHPHQLLLPLQQAQAHALLRVFDVALDRLLLAVHLLQPQVPEGGNDGGEEQEHGRQRREHRVAVLARGRLPAPPVAPPVGNGAFGVEFRSGRVMHE
jgi:hypothetical protein